MDISNPSPDSALSNLTSFVTNSPAMLTIEQELTPAEVSVLSSLLSCGAEIESLSLRNELPAGTGAELGEVIKRSSRIRALLLATEGIREVRNQELIQLAAVSASSTLEQLSIQNFDLEGDCVTKLCDSIINFTALRRLEILHCRSINTLLLERISSLPVLESVCFSKAWPLSSCDEGLVAPLLNLPAMTDLEVLDIEVEGETCQRIGTLIAAGRIQKLCLYHDRLGDSGISALVDSAVLASGGKRCVGNLLELRLGDNNIGPTGAHKITELLAHSPRLRRLELSYNPLGETAALPGCATSLQVLCVAECELGPGGIARFLACPALRVLTMYRNAVGDVGARAVAKFLLLSGRCTLIELRIEDNEITEAGALDLAHGLAAAYALRRINMSGNKIGPKGASAMLEALANASTKPMNEINFATCNIGDFGGEMVGKLMVRRGCERVLLGYNQIGCCGVKAIANSLNDSQCVIEFLNLDDIHAGDEGVKHLLEKVLEQNRSVANILVSLSDICTQGAMAVKRATEMQGALKSILCHGRPEDANARDILNEAQTVEHMSKYEGAATLKVL